MKLDHLVYFTNQKPQTILLKQKKIGRNAIVGGSHEQWGTQNVLLYTQNAYIEWLSVENLEIASQTDHLLTRLLLHDLPNGDAWGTLCISVEGINSHRTRLKEKGFEVSQVFSAQRRTPEGKILRWKMLFVHKDSFKDLPYPFFIEWEESEEKRLKRLTEAGAILESNKALKIEGCILAVTNPSKEASKWAELLDIQVAEDNCLNLSNVWFKFVLAEANERLRLKEILLS